MGIIAFTPYTAQAQQQQQETWEPWTPINASDEPPTFTLVYPDGKTKETAESYEAAQAKLDEWKLLYEGKTNPEGLIELNGWDKEGEIWIVEKVVPTGYWTEVTEWIIDLSEGGKEIVNYKPEINESTLTAIVNGEETAASNDKEAEVECEDTIDVTIKDEVTLKALEKKEVYTLTLHLYDVESGELVTSQEFAEKIKGDDSNEATVTVTFDEHITKEGTYTVKSVLTREGVEGEIAAHNAELDDKSETIVVKKVEPKGAQSTVTLRVIKEWDDDKDTHDQEVTFKVLANGEAVKEGTLTAENNWEAEFADLDEKDSEGKAIEYTVEEDALDYYLTDYVKQETDDGTIEWHIVNINRPWIPKAPGTPGDYGSFTIQKTGNVDEDTAFEIKFEYELPEGMVLPNGTNKDSITDQIKISDGEITVEYVQIGTKVTITELTTGYLTTITVDGEEGNTFEVKKDEIAKVVIRNEVPDFPDVGTEEKPEPQKTTKNPKTGDSAEIGLWVLLTAVGLFGIVSLKRRNKKA